MPHLKEVLNLGKSPETKEPARRRVEAKAEMLHRHQALKKLAIKRTKWRNKKHRAILDEWDCEDADFSD